MKMIKKNIIDTTLRDGEQSPHITMSKQQKTSIAIRLEQEGIHQIEAGIPSIGNFEIDVIRDIMALRKTAKISVWSRLNIEDIQKCGECEPDLIHISVPVSYVQIYKRLNKNKIWVQNNLTTCIEEAYKYCAHVSVGFEDASRAETSFLIQLCKMLGELSVSQVRFADTVGVLHPLLCYKIIQEIVQHSPVPIGIHAHNDLGLATANSIMAAKAGALYVDTTVGGIGERAGNCNLNKLLHGSERYFDWGISKSSAHRLETDILPHIICP